MKKNMTGAVFNEGHGGRTKLEGMEEELELIGFGMWKDRSEMGNSSRWVAELRENEWNRLK